MNKLSKIFLAIIIILVIALIGITMAYFNVRKAATDNMNNFLNALEKVHELEVERDLNSMEKNP